MNKQENKRLVKNLIENYKEINDQNLVIEKITVIKRPRIDEKYVSKNDYKELVALYEFLKDNPELSVSEIEKLVDENQKKFKFLNKCLESIFNFVTELKCRGPYFIAKEMSRQGREIDHINNNLIKK